MSQKITANMPEGIVVSGDYKIRFAAVDPSTGAAVSGVKVSNVDIDGVPQGATTGQELKPGPFMLVPGPGA